MGTEVRDAATVLLVRDEPRAGGAPALEVFMVRRHADSGFVGGHHVFPGGVVDEDDRDPHWISRSRGPVDPFAVAAVRELLEEAAVLLAADRASGLPTGLPPERLAALARDVHTGTRRFLDACDGENLDLLLDELAPWSHWITPEGQPRRYDTWFFVAIAPPEQEAVHDELELTEGVWATPDEFLRRHEQGELQMILPTVANLKSIARFPDTRSLMSAARSRGAISPTAPEMRREADGSVAILVEGEVLWHEPPPRN